METDTQTCVRCQNRLPRTAVFFDRQRSLQRTGGVERLAKYCKGCRAAKVRGYAANTRDRRREYYRTAMHHLKKYGLTKKAYDTRLTAQGSVCAICRGVNVYMHGRQIPLAVDHDHGTGKIRCLLCNKCNTVLGQFRDSEELFISAVEYLRRARGVSPDYQEDV